MITIQEEKELKAFNTFGVSCIAREFVEVTSSEELRASLDSSLDIYVLGGGSNLLLPSRFDRRIILMNIQGIEKTSDSEHVIVDVGAGVVWHDLVTWAVDHDLGGIENLALIPGTVGAAPIQNIGAYGVELKDVFLSLEGIDLNTREKRLYDHEACRFGYRDSVFKNELKGQFCVTSVKLRLTPGKLHSPNLNYGSLSRFLAEQSITEPALREVYNAVIAIRQSKLPDPNVIGNCGSFFKNVVINRTQFEALKKENEDLIFFELADGNYKIPTGWLIEKCGWKGKRVGNVGCYEKQALVLVNHGGATSEEVFSLASRIMTDVQKTFGLSIEPEVNIL